MKFKLVVLFFMLIFKTNAQIFDNGKNLKALDGEYVAITLASCMNGKTAGFKNYLVGNWGKDSLDIEAENNPPKISTSKSGLRKLEQNMIDALVKHQLRDSLGIVVNATEIVLFNAMSKAGFDFSKKDPPFPIDGLVDYSFNFTVYTFKRKSK